MVARINDKETGRGKQGEHILFRYIKGILSGTILFTHYLLVDLFLKYHI